MSIRPNVPSATSASRAARKGRIPSQRLDEVLRAGQPEQERQERQERERAREALDKAVAQEKTAIDKLETTQKNIQNLRGAVSMHMNLYRSPYSRDWKRQKVYAERAQESLAAAKAAVPGLQAEVEAAKQTTNRALEHLKVVDPEVARNLEGPIMTARQWAETPLAVREDIERAKAFNALQRARALKAMDALQRARALKALVAV